MVKAIKVADWFGHVCKHGPVGAAAGCDLLILFFRTSKSEDRSLRQLLQGRRIPKVGASLLSDQTASLRINVR